MTIDESELARTILALAAARGADRTIDPADAARAMDSGPEWHRLMPVVRRAAVRLALDGRLVIYRKGKPADPLDFKGVYRLGIPRND